MLAMMIAWPMVSAPLPIEVPKLQNMLDYMLQASEGRYIIVETPGQL